MNRKLERFELLARLGELQDEERVVGREHAWAATTVMHQGHSRLYVVHQMFASAALAVVDWYVKLSREVATAPTEESALGQYQIGTSPSALQVVRLTAHAEFLKKLGDLSLGTVEAAYRNAEPGHPLNANDMATAFAMLTVRDRHTAGCMGQPLGISPSFGEPPTTPSKLPPPPAVR